MFTSSIAQVSVLATSTSAIVAPLPTVDAPLLSVGVATMSAPEMLPPPSSASLVPPSIVLASTSPSTSSHCRVSLDHIYTSNDADSLWCIGYKPEKKTPVGFVSTFDKKSYLINWHLECY